MSFLTMEWIEGVNLATLMARDGRLAKDAAAGISRQIAEGLAAAHDEGVVHRDLKPSNIMVDERGVVRITDFGLAEVAASVDDHRATEGTPFYMAPEQLEGLEATARSDVYALGLVMFELFTGRPAFDGETVAEMVRQRKRPPPAPSSVVPGIPRSIDRLVLRCLDADPSRRPPSAREVAAAFPAGKRHAAALAAAQRRADRIGAFREELAELRRIGLVRLDDGELLAVDRHHARVLNDLVKRFDVDVSERGKQISLGMRIVSVIGAAALAASVYLFFYRIWGVISVPAHVAILIAAPLFGLFVTDVVAGRDRTRYFTSIAGLFAFACLVIDLIIAWTDFGQLASPWGLLVWGTFGLILAFAYRLPLLLLAGLASLAGYVGATVTQWAGIIWLNFLERPEGLLPAALLLLAPAAIGGRQPSGFGVVERAFGMIFLLAPMFLLGLSGGLSYLPYDPEAVSVGYQILGFATCAVAIWLGIVRRRPEPVYTGAFFSLAFLYMKFAHWWWSWMPKYAFFLIVAATAIASLWILKRLRAAIGQDPREAES